MQDNGVKATGSPTFEYMTILGNTFSVLSEIKIYNLLFFWGGVPRQGFAVTLESVLELLL